MPRFDEIELRKHTTPDDTPAEETPRIPAASRVRRILTFVTDLSLFVALFTAMSPLIQWRATWIDTVDAAWPELASLAAFVLIVSYYYFVLCWLIWGRTVGGAIFEVRVISENGAPVDFVAASRRWVASLLSLATAGLGFLPALLPSARSVPDRVSTSVPAHVE